MKRTILFFATILFLSFSSIHSQGKLDKAEKSLSKKTKSNSSNPRSRTYDSSDSGSTFIGDTFGELFISVFWGLSYGVLFETSIEQEYRASNASFTKYPYYNNNKGNYAYDWGENTTLFKVEISDRYIVENGRLYGNHLKAKLFFAQRISVEGDYLQLWEDNTNFGNNALAMYQFLAKYHRVRTERFNAWWGLGATHVDGEVDETGFTYGLGAELFFAKPMSIESSFTQTLINDQTINQFEALLNYHLGRCQVSGGYEYLTLGNQNFSMLSVGVGLSF